MTKMLKELKQGDTGILDGQRFLVVMPILCKTIPAFPGALVPIVSLDNATFHVLEGDIPVEVD